MHLWPSLRIRDSFKHGYLQKLELNLGLMKRAQRQGQGQQGEGQEDQGGQTGEEKAPLLEDRSPPGSVLASALELAWDAVLLFTCCCCCFCCGAHASGTGLVCHKDIQLQGLIPFMGVQC
ncbi:hypothetical protein HU200_031579 [Digitaria exilis]|uniref:Uncharacterized protein n=1 Tax=Digitaria exilis TaxID=1010633 RepID=A0A835ER64_9POAL|nr:hypothetical protein HU200_031579 [Digitaria exilis]